MFLEKWFCTPVWYDYTEFNFEHAAEQCKLISKTHTNRTYSNVGGWQSTDMNLDEYEGLREVKEIIDLKIDEFSKDLGSSVKMRMDNCWLNLNYRENYNMRHVHPLTAFSGIIYISVNEDTGNLVFYNDTAIQHYPSVEYDESDLLHRTVTYKPKNGMVLIFPAWAPHSVSPNMSDEVRISLAFNIVQQK